MFKLILTLILPKPQNTQQQQDTDLCLYSIEYQLGAIAAVSSSEMSLTKHSSVWIVFRNCQAATV